MDRDSAISRLKVLHHERKRGPGHFSIERLFAEIRRNLPPRWVAERSECPYPSKGFLPRLRNVSNARQLQADVHHVVGDVHYLVFGLPALRTVLTIHDCAALSRLRGVRREILKYFWFSGPVARAGVTTTISEASKQELRQWLGPLADNIEVVPDCVFGAFTLEAKAFDAACPVCLQVGTKWNKNVERVAQALRGVPCRLEVVGTLSDSQRQCLRECSVSFVELGSLSDTALVEAYRRCDMVLFASLYEGFGLPILEGQATGRPVITSGHGAMKEAAGEGALFVDPMSPESIRGAVLQIMGSASLRGRLLQSGLANVERFRPVAIARRYAEIYDRLGAGAQKGDAATR